jgi:putative ABC transport system permease protein
MMREEKLYSAMYIAGTALAVAFVMLIAEVYYVKVADMAPEVRRSTTYYLDFLPLKSDPNTGAPLNHEVFRTLFQKMNTSECVTGAIIMYHDRQYMKMADGLHDRAVTYKAVEPGFFRFYEYRFVQGVPFTQDDFDNGRSVAVITDEISDQLFGRGADAVGKTISVSNFDFRVCGVVETPSALMEESVADVWMPYSATWAISGWEVNWRETPIDVTFSVPEAKRKAFMQELKEVETRYNSVHKGQEADMTSHLKSHYSKVWEGIADVFDAWNKNLIWYVAPAILLLLLVPALNLSGMVASRMERQLPEMAIRKAFGAKRRTLLEQVIMENLVLTLIGGVIGLCIAWTALYAWRDWVFYVFSDSSNLYGSVPIVRGEMLFGPAIFLTALLVCCVLTVLAATVPAWFSLKKPIVESMMIKK